MGVEAALQAEQDPHRQMGLLSLGKCANTAAQTVLVQGQSRAGGWFLHTHKGKTTTAEAVAPHNGTMVSVPQRGRCGLRKSLSHAESGHVKKQVTAQI